LARLLLVRHGITEFNSTRRFAGYSDIEMSTTGIRQVEKLRDRLANEKIDVVYSSDLKRAMLTAEIICTGRKLDILPCPELREVNYGEVEGLTYPEIRQHYPEVAELVANFNLRLKFPEGESFEEFIERVCRFADRLKRHAPSETVLVVSHSGPLRTLVCALMGIAHTCWWQLRFDNASLSIVDTYPRGAILTLLNDTSHLKDLNV
jgi:alpha-ribazole phosphatase